MDFPTTSIEDHVYTFWVHGYILLEKEGNYSLELQDYARCWLLVYLYKWLLGRGSLICLNVFKIRSWAGNVVGENQLTNLFLLPVNIFVSWEALWIIPKMQGWPSPFQIWGSSLMQKFVHQNKKFCSYLRKMFSYLQFCCWSFGWRRRSTYLKNGADVHLKG